MNYNFKMDKDHPLFQGLVPKQRIKGSKFILFLVEDFLGARKGS
jgi:hypothetical protein